MSVTTSPNSPSSLQTARAENHFQIVEGNQLGFQTQALVIE